MIALDTNILARAIVVEQDADEATLLQQQRAKALLASGDTLFVPITVIQELEWVLRGAYDLPQAEIAAVGQRLRPLDPSYLREFQRLLRLAEEENQENW